VAKQIGNAERSTPTESKPVKANDVATATQATAARRANDPTGLSTKAPLQFGLNGPVKLEDVPAGRFHDQLAGLPGPARDYALKKLGDLHVPMNDARSLNVDQNGRLFYGCAPPAPGPQPVKRENDPAPPAGGGTANGGQPKAGSIPVSTPPIRHSRPGASKVIYLDFNGHTITGTEWNTYYGVTTYVAKPYDTDGDPTTFSDIEQAAIIDTWSRVAEDYAPFDVDVTTEEPAVFTSTTGRAVITSDIDQNGTHMPEYGAAAGVAYLDVFGESDYVSKHSPALIYYNTLYGVVASIAEVVSHEMGHNFSLSHDGTSSQEYYDGHGSGTLRGARSWGIRITRM